MVGKPSQRSGSGQKTLPEVRKWSGDPSGNPEVVGYPPGCVELVGRPFRRSGSGRDTLQEVRKWSRDLSVGPEVVG